MMKRPEANIARAVSFEVGALEGELNAIIVRVEHAPLADAATVELPSVFVFVLDRNQAAELQRQLLDALGWFGANSPRTGH
ncbi:hypothetical protein D3C86_1285760 [compost metagenome]